MTVAALRQLPRLIGVCWLVEPAPHSAGIGLVFAVGAHDALLVPCVALESEN